MSDHHLSTRTLGIGLWAGAFLTFGIGDTLTTIIILGQRNFMGETNPVVAGAVATFGPAGFVILKALVFGCALLVGVYVYRTGDRLLTWLLPLLVMTAGAYTTVSNLGLLL